MTPYDSSAATFSPLYRHPRASTKLRPYSFPPLPPLFPYFFSDHRFLPLCILCNAGSFWVQYERVIGATGWQHTPLTGYARWHNRASARWSLSTQAKQQSRGKCDPTKGKGGIASHSHLIISDVMSPPPEKWPCPANRSASALELCLEPVLGQNTHDDASSP